MHLFASVAALDATVTGEVTIATVPVDADIAMETQSVSSKAYLSRRRRKNKSSSSATENTQTSALTIATSTTSAASTGAATTDLPRWHPSSDANIIWQISLSTVPSIAAVQTMVKNNKLAVIDVDAYDAPAATIAGLQGSRPQGHLLL